MSKQKEALQIDGMSCQHCVSAVERALERVDGAEVESVEIGRATVVYDDAATSFDALRAAVEDEGYTVTDRASV